MSDLNILMVIIGCFGVLGLGILFLYKKLIGIINKKQKELTIVINNKYKDTAKIINNRYQDTAKIVNSRVNTMPNDLSNLVQYTGDKKTLIMFNAFQNNSGGIETRWRSFFPYLEQAGYRIVIITGKNSHSKNLVGYKTYFLNLKSSILTEEIIRICNFEKASLIEFHDNLFEIDIERMKTFLIIGFAPHFSIYLRTNFDWAMNEAKKLDETNYKHLDFVVENSGVNADWDGYKNVKADVIYNSIDTKKYSSIFKNVGQKKALLVSRLSIEKLRNIEIFIVECQNRGIAFDIIGVGKSKEYLQITYNLSDDIFLGQLSAVDYMQNHGTNYLFVAGVGQVNMESMVLGFPSLCITEKPAFITKNNFEKAMYNNFARDFDIETSIDKQFDNVYSGKLEEFDCRDLVVKHLDLETNAKKYLAIYEKAMEKRKL